MLDFPRWKLSLIFLACAFFALAALPNMLPQNLRDKIPSALPSRTVNLGLDLQGGSQLLLELDFAAYEREKFQSLMNDVRGKLRAERVGYTNLKAGRDRVTFTVRRDTLPADTDIYAVIKKIDSAVTVEAKGDDVTLSFSEDAIKQSHAKLLEQSIGIINRRINETGTKEPTIQRQGDSRILLQVPGLDNPEKLKNILGKTAKMTFHMVRTDVDGAAARAGVLPPGVKLVQAAESEAKSGGLPSYPVDATPLLTGEMLTGASATFDSSNRPVVSFQFDADGTRRFADATAQNVGKPFAIVLDDKVITAPRIREPILGGSGVISGSFTPESANELALLLRAGALPVPLSIIEERSVGPSLGADSVAAGKMASLIGVALVVVFMLLSYGLFGIFANIALLMNLVIILGVLSLFQATLTLPGIAGIVLTLGMAVDANVLIYERIREEIRAGRSPFAAVEAGFKMAFGTIFDSNLTTLIAAFLLFALGTGTVKGFAVTLAIGILSSMFTAITLTRLMVVAWLKRKRPKFIPI